MAHYETTIGDKQKSVYIDGWLKERLEGKVKLELLKKDKDYVMIIDGYEGAGKSVLAQQVGMCVDKNLNLKRICMNPLEFRGAILQANKGECVIYDEALGGLSARGSLSEINKILVTLITEMRQKNLFVIVVLPSFFLLERYVALWRAKCLIHVYEHKGKRGYWKFWGNRKMNNIYLMGKKSFTYNIKRCASIRKGRFLDGYMVDEQEYRNKKRRALQRRDRFTRSEKFKEQRDKIIYIIYKYGGETAAQIAEWCNLEKVQLKKSIINEVISKFKGTGEKETDSTLYS